MLKRVLAGLIVTRATAITAFLVAVAGGTAAHSQSLDDQERCAGQATKAFQQWVKEDALGALEQYKTLGSDYQSHFNTHLQKCLVLITSTHIFGKRISNSSLLMDPYERRVYGTYTWMTVENKKYWEVPPIDCELISSFNKTEYCTSQAEFDAFVAQYLEQ